MPVIFLATTALRDFWNEKAQTVFLGEWCFLYKNCSTQDSSKAVILPYPFNDRGALRLAASYCDTAYRKALHILALFLNEAHDISMPLGYWKALIGPWLSHYVQILYERYVCLRAAFAAYPMLSTYVLDPRVYETPKDFVQLMSLVPGDMMNLQLYSQLLKAMGYDKLDERLPLQVSKSQKRFQPTVKLQIKALLSNRKIYAYLRGRRLWYFHPKLGPQDWVLNFILSGGRSVPTSFSALTTSTRKKNPLLSNVRRKLEFLDTNDTFLKILFKTLPVNLPTDYLEGFPDIRKTILDLIALGPPEVLILQTSDYSSAALFAIAELKNKGGTRLIAVQHGGSYGTIEISPQESHEQEIMDEYWSWGWEDGLASKAVPQPALFFRNISFRKKKQYSILYAGNEIPRYAYRLWSNPIGPQWARVILWQQRWLRAFPDKIRRQITIRLYPNDDYGWDQKQRLQDLFHDLQFQTGKYSLKESLEKCCLFITDSNHTTYLEAFAMGVPTIIFWDPSLNELRKSAQPFFNDLHSAGILHYSPESAADLISKVYGEPQKWWHSSRVQTAVVRFKRQFAYTVDHAYLEWARLLSLKKTTAFHDIGDIKL